MIRRHFGGDYSSKPQERFSHKPYGKRNTCSMTEDTSISIDACRSSVHEFQSLPIFENELDLTPEETAAREEWWEQRDTFIQSNRLRFNIECSSQEELLRNCILPPSFKADKVSKRRREEEQNRGAAAKQTVLSTTTSSMGRIRGQLYQRVIFCRRA